MSIDRKAQNGKGTRRIDSGGDLSTTVQTSKATAAFVGQLKGEFSMDAASQADIARYAKHNIGQARSAAKGLRAKSDVVMQTPVIGGQPAPKKGGAINKGKKAPPKGPSNEPAPQPETDYDVYVTDTAKKFQKGGESL